MTDEREKLINDLYMLIASKVDDMTDVKNELYILISKYEIVSRCTDIVEIKEDRNERLLQQFLIAKTVKGLTKRTLKYYRTELGRILQVINKTVDDITADDIRIYLAQRKIRDKVTKTTIGNDYRVLSAFFDYLYKEEIIKSNPIYKIDSPKKEKTKKTALTDLEVELLRNACRDEREKAIFEILLSTGCRVTELVSIMLTDIDNNKILVHGKGEKDRYVYLNAKAVIATEKYLAQRKDDSIWLFPSGKTAFIKEKKKGYKKKELESWWKYFPEFIENRPLNIGSVQVMMRKMAKRAGVERANPHKLRRTSATNALRHGMPIEQVSKMLGHEQISTTQIYLDLAEDELEQAHKKYVV
ncbi:MAG: tyrosine-type recombinase/integrase [Lachnospiraceae bacterium]|nr:tyrosine-type recombinase/integrase [Lachnospiraceae bacterium]